MSPGCRQHLWWGLPQSTVHIRGMLPKWQRDPSASACTCACICPCPRSGLPGVPCVCHLLQFIPAHAAAGTVISASLCPGISTTADDAGSFGTKGCACCPFQSCVPQCTKHNGNAAAQVRLLSAAVLLQH